jgi:hypothetical protein
LPVEDADELDDLQQLEDAGDLNVNAHHQHNTGNGNVSFFSCLLCPFYYYLHNAYNNDYYLHSYSIVTFDRI